MARHDPGRQDATAAGLGVLLGADGVTGRRTGIGRVTLEVARTLCNLSVGNPGRLAGLALLIGDAVSPPEILDRATQTADAPRCRTRTLLAHARAVASRCPTAVALHAWRLRRLLDNAARDMARRIGGGVVYHESNLIARPFDGATVVMMHDLSWRADPALHPPERVAWIERRLPATLRQATRFVSVSDFTARTMVATLGIDRARIDVVSPGVSPMFRPMAACDAAPVLARHGLADRSYILAVSTIEPRKNFDRLLAAHTRLPVSLRSRTPLVIAGGRGWGRTLDDDRAAQARRDGTLHLLGHLPDAELVALYARAAVVAYPSLYEGFGLPVLEAMACAAPVVTSDGTALRDTAGDAALLVDPLDTDAITAALRRVLEDPELAASLRARGSAHAARFTWDRTAAGMIESWRTALAA
jgi:glycosyltransferase involved in cell wall biosynthesis